jgi:Ca2+-binding RTX toxin-like protein
MLGFVRKCARYLFQAGRPHRVTRSRNRRNERKLVPRFEALESRKLLAANQIGFDDATSTILIQGSPSNDTAIISVAPDGAVQVQLATADGSYNSVFPKSTAKAVRFVGGDGNDTFQNSSALPAEAFGDAGADTFVGGSNTDRLFGGAGDDTLIGGEGFDYVDGGDGNDWLSGWKGKDTVIGGSGDDYLVGGTGNDVMHGDDGADEIQGEQGNDRLTGGAGNDLLVGALGDDKLYGGTGDDHLSGEDGNDELYGNDGVDWLSGWTGDDIIFGGAGNDKLIGAAGNDHLDGEDGADELLGDDGNDWLWGGPGNDLVYGNLGNNYLIGGKDDDSLVGSTGNDLLDGGAGRDRLAGSEGDDVLIGGHDQDELLGENGNDLLLGGTTVYEDRWESYSALLNEWTSSAVYATRIERMESALFAARLESGETVLDDGVADALFGGGWQDWFFVTGSMPVYRPENVEPLAHAAHADVDHHHHPSDIVTELPALEGFELIDSLDHLGDRQTDETIHSLVPHADNSRLQREHLSLFELVRYDELTHIAVRSGEWSDAATWADGVVPSHGARILIPLAVEVKVNRVVGARIDTIRVDGTLSFDTTRNTELRVDTLVVSSHGTFQMGTAAEPIAAGVQAKLLFTSDGAIDRAWDPFGISRGLISHGKVEIHGAEVSSYVALAGPVAAGAQTLQLKSAPVGWKVGDSVVVAGTVTGTAQNEVRTIAAVSGSTIQLDQPLSYAHAAPAANFDVHVANLARNALFESESPINARRGHIMFMHSRDVDVAYAGFYGLGRTEKLKRVDDAVVGTDWTLARGTGTNPRGRYAVHFHRNGLTNDGNPAVIKGSAVVDSPGWGFVNHSSYVDMIQNVAFDVSGAAFTTEVGDEIGGFYQNLAIGSTGSGEGVSAREVGLQDFGHGGEGFWFQGAGVSVVGNIAAGNQGGAFAFYTRGLYEGGPQARFLSANLADPSIANGAATISVGLVPMRAFKDNVGYASSAGLLVRYHLEDSMHGARSVFENSAFWNNTTGVALHYAQNVVLRNVTAITGQMPRPAIGIEQNLLTGNVEYDHLTVSGYVTGVDLPRWGNNVVRGGTFSNNDSDITISSAALRERSVLLTDFTSQPKILMWEDLRPISQGTAAFFFVRDAVVLNYGSIVNQQLYYLGQRPTTVLFPTPREDVPAEYVGLTNQQLLNQFGIALGGELMPSNTFSVPYITGGRVAPRP